MKFLDAMEEIKKGKTMISPTNKVIKYNELNDDIMVHDEDNWWIYLSNGLSRVDIEGEWRYQPKYISFEEAMSRLKNGETVRFHHKIGDTITIGYKGSMDWTRSYSWEKLIEGKWSL